MICIGEGLDFTYEHLLSPQKAGLGFLENLQKLWEDLIGNGAQKSGRRTVGFRRMRGEGSIGDLVAVRCSPF